MVRKSSRSRAAVFRNGRRVWPKADRKPNRRRKSIESEMAEVESIVLDIPAPEKLSTGEDYVALQGSAQRVRDKKSNPVAILRLAAPPEP